MEKVISVFIDVFTKNSLTVTLAILGVICIGIAIIGKIPPMEIKGFRAIVLGMFGLMLIFISVLLAWLLSVTNIGQPIDTKSPTQITTLELTSTPVIQPSATMPQDIQRPNITPSLPQPTIVPSSVNYGQRWEQEVDKVPTSGTQLKWELAAGQILFLSGGQIRVNGEYCGGDAKQICVVIYKATTAQTLVADALIPENNWYGISSILNPEEALSEKEPQFWYQPNCISGCQKATILIFTDGLLVNKLTRNP